MRNTFSRNFLFLASFIEGSALMAVEILCGKLIAPYYGTSLYVWSCVIGITMGGLALGYYAGGVFSEKRISTVGRLMLLFVVSSFLMFMLPHLANVAMEYTLGMEIRTGLFLSCLVFMLPAVVCFGMVSPVIIRLLASDQARIGYSAGLVYAVSTAGGILFTFLTGFYFITSLGIAASAHFIGYMLLIPPLIYYARIIFVRKKERVQGSS